MELHTCLWNDVEAFDFGEAELSPITQQFPQLSLRTHRSNEEFLATATTAELLVTWEFNIEWYKHCPKLEAIFTPAAGNDWVPADPSGHTKVEHGTFHGGILAESLLSAILYMNHHGYAMRQNFLDRDWNRNLQSDCRLLAEQTVLLVGIGNIGQGCAELISATGASVIGVRRDPNKSNANCPVYPMSELSQLLPQADHVVLLLPGVPETDGFLNRSLIRQCKPGVYLYNFGRGTTLKTEDLLATWDHIGGAYLDVTDEEPLPKSSALWEKPNIMITPHSSCVYQDYRIRYVQELISRLQDYVS